MKKKLKGGIESVIAVIIIAGIVVALLVAAVVPMAKDGDELLQDTTSALVEQQKTIGPGV